MWTDLCCDRLGGRVGRGETARWREEGKGEMERKRESSEQEQPWLLAAGPCFLGFDYLIADSAPMLWGLLDFFFLSSFDWTTTLRTATPLWVLQHCVHLSGSSWHLLLKWNACNSNSTFFCKQTTHRILSCRHWHSNSAKQSGPRGYGLETAAELRVLITEKNDNPTALANCG